MSGFLIFVVGALVIGLLLFGVFLLLCLVRLLAKKQKQTYNDEAIEHTTQLPIPLGAMTCVHQWDVVMNQPLDGELETKVVLVMKCDKCGVIDKTIEKAEKVCRHQWTDSETLNIESGYEQLCAAHREFDAPTPTAKNAWLFRKVAVRVNKCVKCGLLDRVEATNVPELNKNIEHKGAGLSDQDPEDQLIRSHML